MERLETTKGFYKAYISSVFLVMSIQNSSWIQREVLHSPTEHHQKFGEESEEIPPQWQSGGVEQGIVSSR